MAGEANVYADMAAALRRFDRAYHGTRIENAVGSGTPDVSQCVLGVEHWVEMKGMIKWPRVPDDRIIQLDHELRDTQRKWLRNRWAAGGNCWVVLGIREPKEWLIWAGNVAALHLGYDTRENMCNRTALWTMGDFPAQWFADFVTRRQRGIFV